MANFYIKKIDNCMDCDYHKVERIYTGDSWDHEYGCYCGLCLNRKVAQDDWDLRKYSQIPDWCPMLNKKENKND